MAPASFFDDHRAANWQTVRPGESVESSPGWRPPVLILCLTVVVRRRDLPAFMRGEWTLRMER